MFIFFTFPAAHVLSGYPVATNVTDVTPLLQELCKYLYCIYILYVVNFHCMIILQYCFVLLSFSLTERDLTL